VPSALALLFIWFYNFSDLEMDSINGFNALTTLGTVFLATRNWSLINLTPSVFNFLIQAFSPPITVCIVLLSQDSTFRMGEDDIDAFIKGLFHDRDCEWLCDRYEVGKRREGVSRSAIDVCHLSCFILLLTMADQKLHY
jgi:hypothetical protein